MAARQAAIWSVDASGPNETGNDMSEHDNALVGGLQRGRLPQPDQA
jgi:hypothetical protein